MRAVNYLMKPPRILAAHIAAAATRLAGTVVLDLADMAVGPAVYRARLDAFETIEGEEMGADDGTLVPLLQPGEAIDLVQEHGTPGKAAAAVNARIKREWGVA